MIYFTANNTIHKKITFSTLLVFSFAIGLFLFFSNKYLFTNYKSYYFKSYSFIVPYKLKEVASGLHVFGRTGLSSKEYAESVPVLLYHGVLGGDINSNGEATNIDLQTFWDQ